MCNLLRTGFFCLIAFLFYSNPVFAQSPAVFTDSTQLLAIGLHTALLQDQEGRLTIDQVSRDSNFIISRSRVPNLGISEKAWWVRFSIRNSTQQRNLLLELAYPTIDQADLYRAASVGPGSVQHTGIDQRIGNRKYDSPNYIFELDIPPGQERTYYLRVKSIEQIQLPLFVGIPSTIMVSSTRNEMIFGLYFGIILVMVVYNLFIFFSVKDKSYISYVVYIIFVGLTQATLKGYGYKYLWPFSPWFAMNSTFLIPIINGIAVAEFLKSFLRTKIHFKFAHWGINLFEFFYFLCLPLTLLHIYYYGQILLQFTAMGGSFFAIYAAYVINRRGYRPARWFLLAFSLFLVCVIIFVLRNFNILPYNNFTLNVLEIGSALEITLLSFALADRINIYKKEKEESQARALAISLENEQIIREQNVVLEANVQQRTEELRDANTTLTGTLRDLKDAQSQLVDAEKMASLGQLTAGIAHEINNPINFVKSNIRPLQLDIHDLQEVIRRYESVGPHNGDDISAQIAEIESFKKEIDLNYINEEIQSLIKGIEDGAVRTAEIVKELRTFSRLDESELKQVDVHEGIDSTLVLLRNYMPKNIRVERKYADLPLIECFPGKLNQVFMNLLNNAIFAIKDKKSATDEFIRITTQRLGKDEISISIADTGTGMTPEVKARIFEPFFTTKDVGEGTGLGLSIVFSIIEKHGGHISVESLFQNGTIFTLTLPIMHNPIPGA
jgi:two-component system NtrC family sensor kinase